LPIKENYKNHNNYYVGNELESPVCIYSYLGVENYQFDAFGKINNNKDLYGFTGYQNDDNDLLYGQARYYLPEIGRFISEDSYKGNLVDVQSLNTSIYCNNNPLRFIDPSGNIPEPTSAPSPNSNKTPDPNKCGEYIVLTGSEYDDENRYKYNFVETSILALKNAKENNPNKKVTWVVSKSAYSEDDMEKFNEIAEDIGVNIVYIENEQDLYDYINTGGESEEYRRENPITNFDVFSHGHAGRVDLGYTLDNANDLEVTVEDLSKVNNYAFKDTTTRFFSCNAGTSYNNGNSLAQEWVNKTGGSSSGAVDGLTDYANANKGQGFWDKFNRWRNGFNTGGSKHLPEASDGVEWGTFTPQ
jgi:RHS repeat-associated protein